MKCIICDKDAIAKGSHIIPASLIQNCIGKHYAEESYGLDSSNASVDIYFGRDNLKNTNTEIKKHHFKEDNILCQICENKLSKLEGEFSTEFLQKFRIEKFKTNFEAYSTDEGFEIFEPKKISNIKILAYIYSIILRYCRNIETKDGVLILSEDELIKIRTFVNGFLYELDSNYCQFITDYSLILVFNKYSDKGSIIFTFEEFKSPYIFYFCEVIVQLYTNIITEKVGFLLNDCINNVYNERSKLIIGPSILFNELIKPTQEILSSEFITNSTKLLCKLNGKIFHENLLELNEFIAEYESKGIKNAATKAINKLLKKYGG